MKFQTTVLYFLVLLCSSFWIGSILYGSYHHDNIFAMFHYCGAGLLWLICFYIIIRNERKNTGTQLILMKHWMSFVSVCSLVPIILIFLYYQRILNSPTFIKAKRHGVYADFKTDGTYIIKSGSWASKIHVYGKYTLQDSIIEIDRPGIDQILVSNRLLLRNTNFEDEMKNRAFNRIRTEKYLVQIDNRGELIKNCLLGKDSTGAAIFVPYQFEVVMGTKE